MAVPGDLHRALRMRAADGDTTMTAVVVDALRDALGIQAPARRGRPPKVAKPLINDDAPPADAPPADEPLPQPDAGLPA